MTEITQALSLHAFELHCIDIHYKYLIYQLVVKESVNPVNAHVSEKQERDHAENQPGPT